MSSPDASRARIVADGETTFHDAARSLDECDPNAVVVAAARVAVDLYQATPP